MIATAALPDASPGTELTTGGADHLADCESRIERNVRGFVEVGSALAEIREHRLYRGSHTTFDEYLKERWHFGRSYASRLIGAAETVPLLPRGNTDAPVLTEAHIRPLLRFAPEDRPKVWGDAVKFEDEKVSAARIAKKVECLVRTSREEPYQTVRREAKRLRSEREAEARERQAKRVKKASHNTIKPQTFDLQQAMESAESQIEFFTNRWPREHHAELAKLLRAAAEDIEAQDQDQQEPKEGTAA